MIFLKGLLVGLLIGAPVGVIGALIVQRTMLYGVRYGFITGAGSSVADCVYAAVGAFELKIISDFMLDLQTPLGIIGGLFVIGMGIYSIVRKPSTDENEKKPSGKLKSFFSSFTVGITNPAAIIIIIFSFSYLNISSINLSQGIFLLLGVLTGTVIWWVGLSLLADKLSKKSGIKEKISTVFGIIIIILGVIVILKSIYY